MVNRTLLLLAGLLAAAPSAAQRCDPGRTDDRDAARSEAERRFRDSLQAEVIADLRAAGHAEPRGLVVVDVRDRRTGRAEVHARTTPEVEAAVRGIVGARGARLAAWPGRESAFHLRLDPAAPAAEGADECAPEMQGRQRFARDLQQLLARSMRTDQGLAGPGRPRLDVQVRMLVDRDGEVVYAELARRSGREALDRALLQLAERQRFAPATLGGVPADVWVVLPIQIGGT